ncbi:sulfide-dependent adenosine diphosphate thiazole synthase [Candidatus Omnitrophota bacterium]
MEKKFAQVGESQITSAIVKDFSKKLLDHVKSDCIIVGGGPSGLVAGRELAQKGYKVLIIEANNYLGGGFWVGGYLMNGVTFREPANQVLDELSIPYKKVEQGLFLADGPHACSRLITAACEAGVTVLNMTKCDDVVLRDRNRVGGVVINWTAVSSLPRAISCLDPIALEATVVIDASGHDACVVNALAKRNLTKIKGCGAMWVEKSEDALVEKTGQVYPGLIATGMAVSTVFGIPRMGPTFGGMLVSGKKAAAEAEKLLATGNATTEPAFSEVTEEMMT